jgi:hypothetical protein
MMGSGPARAPEVAVAGDAVYLRWHPDDPWTVVQPGRRNPKLAQAVELPERAGRMGELAELAAVRPGDVYPLAGAVGDCPVAWRAAPDAESWWCCALPAGHDRGPEPLPHVAATSARVDAVLDTVSAEQALARRSGEVQLNVA